MIETNTSRAFSLVFHTGETIDHERFLFACRGNFNSSITDNILFLTEGNLLELDTPKIAKKVYYLMVEGLQNITRHQHLNEEKGDYVGGYFVINRHDEAYAITYGNWVSAEIKELLEERLALISNKAPDELKEYYMEILNNSGFSSKGGAGLGLVDMARKSSGNLSYKFVPVDDGYFYYLSLCIAIDKTTFNADAAPPFIDHAIDIHREMIESHGQILFKGLLHEENVNRLSTHIDSTMSANESDGLGMVMAELLKNVAKHAYNKFNQQGKPGVFLLQKAADGYHMLSGNFILKEKKAVIEKVVAGINKMSNEELSAYVEKRSADYTSDPEYSHGKGLVFLRNLTGSSLDYQILEFENIEPFFILQIELPK